MKVSDTYNKQYYDKKHRVPTKYKLGDYVMIKHVDVTPGVNKKTITQISRTLCSETCPGQRSVYCV